jgi:MFS family permease
VWGLAALFYCYEYLLRISPSLFTGDLMRYYSLNGAALGNLIAFYYYAYAPAQLPVGILMDRFGPRVLITLAALGCAIGSFLFAATHLFYVAAIGRFLVGFSSAFAFVGVLKVATIWLPANRFGMIAGLTTSLGMVGAMIGDNLLNLVIERWHWQLTTMLSGVFGIILAIVLWMFVRNARKSIAKTYSPIRFSAIVKTMLVALKQKQVWLAGVVGCCYYIPTSVFAELWGKPYLQDGRGFSSTDAAFIVSMIFLGWAVGGPILGAISDLIRLRKLPLFFGGLIASALMFFALLDTSLSMTVLSFVFFLFGFFSSAQNQTFSISRESCPSSISGTALAITNMLVMLGGMVLQPLVGKLLDNGWDGKIQNGVHVFSNANYTHALMILPIGLAVGAIVTLLIRETHAKAID